MLHEPARKPVSLYFDSFRFVSDDGVYEGDCKLRLSGRPLTLLTILLERPGDVFSRSELEARLWEGMQVEDSNLRVLVAALRKVLGDGSNGRRLIANVPGRGYSFVASVNRAGDTDSVAHPPQRLRHLPTRASGIIGRDTAIAALAATMAHSRLTTIVGHGGIGKTTLALALAERLYPRYPDGCYFVDLASLTDPEHVLPALAAALGLEFRNDSPWEHLGNSISGRRMLVLLDNCEHLLNTAWDLVESLLNISGTVDILATSREPFDMDGESVHRLAPLASPPADGLDCVQALAYPALQLLVERATASIDTFELNSGNVDAAAAVCRRVDGVPLAIEFAAARIGLLGVGTVAAQLDDRLGLLGSGRRTSLPRHRTLRALLAWSYELLAPAEQKILATSAIFRGAFTLDAAISVLSNQATDARCVSLVLPGLAAKSLVSLDMSQPESEFSLLGITRAFALEQLDESTDTNALAQRHAYWVLQQMRGSAEAWEAIPHAAWRTRYLRCLSDLRAAHDWAFQPGGDPGLGIELTAHMRLLALCLMRPDESRQRVGWALRAIESGVPVDPLHEMWIRNLLAHGVDAETMCSPILPGQAEALANAARSNRVEQQIEVLYHLYSQAFGAADYPLASDCARRASTLALKTSDDAATLHCDRMLAQALHFSGEHAHALVRADRVLARASEKVPLPYASSISRRLSMGIVSARIRWLLGQSASAQAEVATCITLAGAEPHPGALCQVLALAACPISIWQGEDATMLINRLDQHAQANQLDYWVVWARALRVGGSEALALAPSPQYAKLLDHLATFDCRWLTTLSLQRAENGLAGWCTAEVLRAHGEQLAASDDTTCAAEKYFMRALTIAREQGAQAWILRATVSLARLWWRADRISDAKKLLDPLCLQVGEGGADSQAAMTLLHEIDGRYINTLLPKQASH